MTLLVEFLRSSYSHSGLSIYTAIDNRLVTMSRLNVLSAVQRVAVGAGALVGSAPDLSYV